jgi:calcium permeable stress-gated cation channel
VVATIFFSFLRPYHQALYAPKLKHADDKHAPPPIGKKPWSWVTTLWQASEQQLVHQVGMDAIIFLRFVSMCRNMFLTLSVIGVCILVPVHWTEYNKIGENQKWITKMTPENTWASAQWAQVVVAYLFNIVIAFFLWWNYRKVVALRRTYFDSEEYQNSLHARTLMVGHQIRRLASDIRPFGLANRSRLSCTTFLSKAALMKPSLESLTR